MRKSKMCLFLLILLVEASCQNSHDPAVEFVQAGGRTIPIIHVEEIRDSIDVSISDWYTNIRLIKLEKTEENLFWRVSNSFVGKEYIVISTLQKGILLFDANGKFLRVIARIGRGPGEVIDSNLSLFVDEENHKLYVNEDFSHREKLICFDLKTNSHHYIDLQIGNNDFGVTNFVVIDSLIYCSNSQLLGKESQRPVFCQTLSGELLWEIIHSHPKGLNNGEIRLSGGEIFFNYAYAMDTVYKLIDGHIVPQVGLVSDRPDRYFVKEPGSIYMQLYALDGKFFEGRYSILTSLNKEPSGRIRAKYSESQYFIFNLLSNEVKRIGRLKDDYFGCNQEFINFAQYNGIGVKAYQAIELIEMAQTGIEMNSITPAQKVVLQKILKEVDAEDNPYLFVGDMDIKLPGK